MKFKSIMHVSFFTDQLDVIRDFYENKLGLRAKMIVRFREYKNSANEYFRKGAEERPDDICIIYIEIVPGQFLEFFPKREGQAEHDEWNHRLGYSHFALLVDDIHAARNELAAKGVPIDTEPSIGNSHTWKMWCHDPDGNKFEVMQYTDKSFQVVGAGLE